MPIERKKQATSETFTHTYQTYIEMGNNRKVFVQITPIFRYFA
jgi:hypothetical protein